MPSAKRSVLTVVLAAPLAFALPAQSEETADPGTILATVEGTEITLGHVIAVRADLPGQYDQFPAAMLFQGILDQLIQQTLLMQSFDGELSLQSEILLENERRALVAGEAIAIVMDGDIDENALRQAYEEQYPEAADETEYRASHILVGSKDEADALVAELNEGADFAALAREHSTGPSAESGGDLGWFGEGDMVADFFEAASALNPGDVSAPVATQFGWHVIRLAETRARQRPEFETVRDELVSQIQGAMVSDHVNALVDAADITRADTSGIDPAAINRFDLLEP